VRYNFFYDLPVGKGKKFMGAAGKGVNAILGGWQISGIGEWRSGNWLGVNSGRYLFGDPTLNADQQLLLKFAGRNQRLWFRGDFDPTLASGIDQAVLQKLVPLDRSQRLLRPVGSAFDNRVAVRLANGSIRQTPITDTVNWNARAFYAGPGEWNIDSSLFKNFQLTEKLRLRFSADFFNVLNHQNDADPNTTTGLQDLSISRPGNSPRIIQFSLRMTF
jgi:hypothetical protein